MNISRSLILVVSAGSTKTLICLLSETLSRMADRYSFLSIWIQSTHRLRERFSMRSSQMRVLRPLPSIKGWATLHKFDCIRLLFNEVEQYSSKSVIILLLELTLYPSGVLIIFQANGMLLPLFTIVILIDTLCVIYVLPQVGS